MWIFSAAWIVLVKRNRKKSGINIKKYYNVRTAISTLIANLVNPCKVALDIKHYRFRLLLGKHLALILDNIF